MRNFRTLGVLVVNEPFIGGIFMKKLRSFFLVLMALCLVFTVMPVATAQTQSSVPGYNNSFLLWVERESPREFTVADFPLVEELSCLYVVKATPTRNGYQYLLIMGLDVEGEEALLQAKTAAETYGKVSENLLAYDYANHYSSMKLNHQSVEVAVGESFDLKMVEHSLFYEDEVFLGILFTIDPEVIDPAALVEGGYKDLGLTSIYGALYEEPESWRENTALLGQYDYESQGKISETNQYLGIPNYQIYDAEVIDALIKQPGIVEAQLMYEHGTWPCIMPEVEFAWEPEGVLALEYQYGEEYHYGTFTALQPGEVVITAKFGGIASGVATATCKVTVVEKKEGFPPDDSANPKTADSSVPLGAAVTLGLAAVAWVVLKKR